MFPCRYGRRNSMNPGDQTNSLAVVPPAGVVGLNYGGRYKFVVDAGTQVRVTVCFVVLVEGLYGKPSAY